MKKHTPGEWIFNDYGGSIVAGEDGWEIARVSPGCDALSLDKTGAEDAANAALVAAAPDLLEAITNLCTALVSEHGENTASWPGLLMDAGDAALVAIAKATEVTA